MAAVPAARWPWLVVALLLGLGLRTAQAQQPVPALVAHVQDQAALLSPAQRSSLESRLRDFEATRGTQVVVLTVTSTAPEDIASYANRVANSWKIGRREVGDGLLIVVSSGERQVRVEVAKSLEGAVPDLAAKRIIDAVMVPRFREGDYAGGLDAGVRQLMARIGGENLPLPPAPAPPAATAQQSWGDIAFLLLLAIPIGALLARRVFGRLGGSVVLAVVAGGLGYLLTASLLIAFGAGLAAGLWCLLGSSVPTGGLHRGGRGGRGGGPGAGWGGGLGGGGLDGGFHSGGGGDFGGGGASGKW